MTPDIDIKGYYLQFIYDAKTDIAEYNKSLDENKKIKEKLRDYLEINIDTIVNKLNIDLYKYTKEWNEGVYNPSVGLYNEALKRFRTNSNSNNRNIIAQIIKYCHSLKNEYKYNKLINIANKRTKITFKEYRNYVSDYYTKVHQTVLEGMGYTFTNGIGTYLINYWKVPKNSKNKGKKIDFKATLAKKKELIEKGIKLYDDKEAAWYKARNIPYDAVDYRVYIDKPYYYEFTFINSKLFSNYSLEYERIEYINKKFRGMGYEKVADTICHTLEDIYNLQVDLKVKLNILLYKDPTKYLNFVRNVEQYKYKYRKNNSQD
jgi:hypothetical protein